MSHFLFIFTVLHEYEIFFSTKSTSSFIPISKKLLKIKEIRLNKLSYSITLFHCLEERVTPLLTALVPIRLRWFRLLVAKCKKITTNKKKHPKH